MHECFQSRPIRISDGLFIIAMGVALMLLLEAEKALLRRLGFDVEGAR